MTLATLVVALIKRRSAISAEIYSLVPARHTVTARSVNLVFVTLLSEQVRRIGALPVKSIMMPAVAFVIVVV